MRTQFAWARSTAVSAILCLLPIAGSAQEAWPFLSLEVHRYDSLINTNKDVGLACCAPHVIQVPGYVLIHVSAVVDVPWTEELDRVSASSSKLTMTVPGGEPVGPIGSYARRGLFETSPGGANASRPRDWPETDKDVNLPLEHVWLLPADATTATLAVDEYFTATIDIPQETSEPIGPADTASFAILGISRVDRLEMAHSFNQQKVQGTVAPAAGTILQVDFAVTPLMDTNVGGDPNFLLYTRYLQLVGPSGLAQVPLGQFLVDGLVTDTTNSFSGDGFIGAAFEKSFYYLSDGAPGTYTLYFHNDPVAEFALE